MAYAKTVWVDEVTPTSAANMNHIEQGIEDSQGLSKAWYTIMTDGGRVTPGTLAGTARVFAAARTALLAPTSPTTTAFGLVPILATDLARSGFVTKLRLTLIASINATPPNATFTLGLYPVTQTLGPSGSTTYNFGARVGTPAVIALPTTALPTYAVGPEFDLPPDGSYVLGVLLDATVDANNETHLIARLQRRYV